MKVRQKLFTVLFLGLWLMASPLLAQKEAPAEEDEFFYERELTYGINLNTNGGLIGGVAGKYAIRIDNRWFHYIGLEIVNVKNPKEERLSNPQTNQHHARQCHRQSQKQQHRIKHMFPNRYPASLISRPLHIRSHAAKVSRRIQIATVKRTYVHGGGMEVGIHRCFFCVCLKLVCSSGPETLPPLVDQRVAASKPVHDVFRGRNPPARPPPDAVDLMNPASQPTAVRHDDHAATESGAVNG
jgi:hypothetical protein